MTAYAVSQRTEIGIRMALGAAPGGVVWLVLRRVGVLVGLGAAAGGAISLWAAEFVEALLYELEPRDPVTLGIAVLVLATTGLMAGCVPAIPGGENRSGERITGGVTDVVRGPWSAVAALARLVRLPCGLSAKRQRRRKSGHVAGEHRLDRVLFGVLADVAAVELL